MLKIGIVEIVFGFEQSIALIFQLLLKKLIPV
jgi:hypothetical protein